MNNKILIDLDYHSFLKDNYQKISDLPGFVLLESTDKTQGRYDILSAYPYDRVIVNESTPDRMRVLTDLKQKLAMSSSDYDLPFQGGAIGYISYDLGAHLMGINALSQPSLQDAPLLDLAFYDWAIIVDHYLKKVTLFAANRNQETSEICKEVLAIWQKDNCFNTHFIVNSSFVPLIAQSAYEASFSAIYRALREGRSYQVNFTQPFHAGYEGSEWEMYRRISFKNQVPFSAFIQTKDMVILSFSPERFLQYDNGALLTSPIKGTIGRSLNSDEDSDLKRQLALCPKNNAENVMIVDLLRNDLGKISYPGSVQVSNLCAIQSYHSVHHLVSDIEAQCFKDLHPWDAFISCFPGGSITGAPKLESMKIINEQEPYARGIYCGCIGYFSQHGRFDMNIAIRTVIAKNDILHLAAGGGITIDSNYEDEYRECYTKIAAIINGLK